MRGESDELFGIDGNYLIAGSVPVSFAKDEACKGLIMRVLLPRGYSFCKKPSVNLPQIVQQRRLFGAPYGIENALGIFNSLPSIYGCR